VFHLFVCLIDCLFVDTVTSDYQGEMFTDEDTGSPDVFSKRELYLIIVIISIAIIVVDVTGIDIAFKRIHFQLKY
jgi:hypothetical protein